MAMARNAWATPRPWSEWALAPGMTPTECRVDGAGVARRALFAWDRRAWPEIRRRTGATLRVIGADPLSVRLLMARHRLHEDGLDLPGFLSEEELTADISSAKMLVAPSLGGESFGMVLTRAYACSTPVVVSDIPGYREVFDERAGLIIPPGDAEALERAVVALLEDEPRRRQMGEAAREAAKQYDWRDIAVRLLSIYERAIAGEFDSAASVRS